MTFPAVFYKDFIQNALTKNKKIPPMDITLLYTFAMTVGFCSAFPLKVTFNTFHKLLNKNYFSIESINNVFQP